MTTTEIESVIKDVTGIRNPYLNKETEIVTINECIEITKRCVELSATQNEWVAVIDGMPDNRTYVLTYTTNGGYTSIAEYKHGCFFKGLDRLHFVTHWMPLPSPPSIKPLNDR